LVVDRIGEADAVADKRSGGRGAEVRQFRDLQGRGGIVSAIPRDCCENTTTPRRRLCRPIRPIDNANGSTALVQKVVGGSHGVYRTELNRADLRRDHSLGQRDEQVP
jgi:hypothetical protein